MSFSISVKYYLKALKRDIKPASVSVTSDMWELITLNVMHAWNKVLNRSRRVHWYCATVCPWVTPSLHRQTDHDASQIVDIMAPVNLKRQVREEGTMEGGGGQKGAVVYVCVCVWSLEGGLGQCDWRGVGRTSAQLQGELDTGDLPQLGKRIHKVDGKVSRAVYTLHANTPMHLCMHTVTNTHPLPVFWMLTLLGWQS